MMPGGYPRLSLTGTGLRTMREGDQMPVFLPESGFHKLYVEGVRQALELTPC